MNIQRVLIVIGVCVVGVIGVYMLMGTDAPAVPERAKNSVMENLTVSATPDIDTSETVSARYDNFSGSLPEAQPNIRRVLFFYASWCPTCRPVDEELREKAATLPAGINVIRVNYNDPDTDEMEKSLAQKYGVTYQHTFVQIDESGTEVTKWNGGGVNELLKNIQ